MRIKPSVGSVVGQADTVHWGQILLTPFAYGVVEVEDADGIARHHGIRMLSTLTHKLADAVVSLHTLERIADEVFSSAVRTVILLVPVGKVVYVVTRGAGRVYLKRGEKLATLTDGPGGISGEVQKGDTLLLVSYGFLQALTHDDLVSAFDHLPAADVAEKLTLLLHKKTNGPGAAAFVFQVSDIVTDEYEPKETETREVIPEVSQRTTLSSVPITPQRKRSFARFASSLSRRVLAGRVAPEKKRSTFLVVGIMLFFLLSVGAGIWRESQASRDKSLEKAMSEARFAFSEGTALLELNAVKGRERLNEAKTILEPLLARASEKSPEGRDLRTLYQEVTQNLSQAMKMYRVTPTLFYDVSLLKKGATGSAFGLSEDKLVILDSQAETVYTLAVGSKNGQMIASGRDIQGARFVAIHGDSSFVFGENGIVAVDISGKNQTLVIKKAPEWGTIADMVSYGGNLYLLDTAKSRIWKYMVGEKAGPDGGQEFSGTLEYLLPDTLPDLSRATSLSIDGSVWVATSDGKILKFTQGREDTFQTQGVEPPFGSSLRIFTDDSLKNLYIEDRENNRIVVLDKEGVYVAQYVWDETTGGVTSFVVSEKEKKLLLLSEGKIFEIPIQ